MLLLTASEFPNNRDMQADACLVDGDGMIYIQCVDGFNRIREIA